MLIINGSTQQQNSTKRQKSSYFTRLELTQILNVYSTRVAAGEWRDYALDHLDGMAFFSIYRSSHEMPLYTIEKKRLKGKDRWMYILRDRRQTLRQAAQIKDILTYLNKLPRLVNN